MVWGVLQGFTGLAANEKDSLCSMQAADLVRQPRSSYRAAYGANASVVSLRSCSSAFSCWIVFGGLVALSASLSCVAARTPVVHFTSGGDHQDERHALQSRGEINYVRSLAAP